MSGRCRLAVTVLMLHHTGTDLREGRARQYGKRGKGIVVGCVAGDLPELDPFCAVDTTSSAPFAGAMRLWWPAGGFCVALLVCLLIGLLRQLPRCHPRHRGILRFPMRRTMHLSFSSIAIIVIIIASGSE
jgi:hypothetical protein